MILVHHPLHPAPAPELPEIPIPADRITLARRRWRGTAADGTDFGFDLETPLTHRAVVHASADARYHIDQQPEPVWVVALGAPADAARLGWLIGNLHFAAQIAGADLVVADDPALQSLFAREGIVATRDTRVFQPMGGGHSHGAHPPAQAASHAHHAH
jgi:urease accessory protein